MLLVCRFSVVGSVDEFTGRARRALELLTAQPGCRRGQLSRSTDDHEHFVLTVEFDSVVAYRRAMSPFDVREHVIPLLSRALPEPSAFEPLLLGEAGVVTREESLVAADAFTVRLGEAGGPATAR
ncbi:antibiotic biosynthesis monooxygenase [Actinosynnema sp. NPDC020468]|uniref:antibiotic biosynthesis monooxygenase family protein n=1 Tax=Actinosynnema sp. NPDC020468 TaxID=3154488 RepID=UPI0033C6ED60